MIRDLKLPDGWRVTGNERGPCVHCGGTGKVPPAPVLHAPSGKTWPLICSPTQVGATARAVAAAHPPNSESASADGQYA